MTFGERGTRTMRGGTNWQLGNELAVGLEATRSEGDGADATADVRLRAALRF